MIALKNILLPTDFSKPSAIALAYAKEFAQLTQASVHVLHVVDLLRVLPWVSAEASLTLQHTVREDIEKKAADQLQSLLSPAEKEKFRAHLVVRTGSPFVEIIRYAREQSIDLVVMGTHGRGPVAHMLLGSVAEKVVRKAPCPVLTVRHPEHEFIMP